VVFDPNTISDTATYPEPNHPAVGVNAVLVIGEVVIRKGRLIEDAVSGEDSSIRTSVISRVDRKERNQK
jgi:N-acyl-D-aspartate/D-glutamate deacylase